jgi:hypothetical protein
MRDEIAGRAGLYVDVWQIDNNGTVFPYRNERGSGGVSWIRTARRCDISWTRADAVEWRSTSGGTCDLPEAHTGAVDAICSRTEH